MRHVAVASRCVSGFEVIWVMWTFLEGVRCGRSSSEVVGRLDGEVEVADEEGVPDGESALRSSLCSLSIAASELDDSVVLRPWW